MAARPQRPLRELRALDAYVKLSRAAESVSARIHRHLAASRLSLRQFAVMEALHHLGPLCQRDIAAKILTTGGNVTMVVDNLEARALARRRRDPKNRRYVYVELTPKGRDVIRKIFPRHVRGLVEELAILKPAEQEELARLCRRLGKQE